MAESWVRTVFGDRVEVWSAGTRPGTGIKDRTKAIMAEVGCSMDGQAPSPVSDLPQGLDWLILMGEGVECPPLGEKNRVDWGFPDLDGTDLATLKSMRDQIGAKVRELGASLM
jgi:arsenate reductase